MATLTTKKKSRLSPNLIPKEPVSTDWNCKMHPKRLNDLESTSFICNLISLADRPWRWRTSRIRPTTWYDSKLLCTNSWHSCRTRSFLVHTNLSAQNCTLSLNVSHNYILKSAALCACYFHTKVPSANHLFRMVNSRLYYIDSKILRISFSGYVVLRDRTEFTFTKSWTIRFS